MVIRKYKNWSDSFEYFLTEFVRDFTSQFKHRKITKVPECNYILIKMKILPRTWKWMLFSFSRELHDQVDQSSRVKIYIKTVITICNSIFPYNVL